MAVHKKGGPLEGFAHFAREVAAEGAVLIKNEGQVLPLIKEDRVSVFGRTQFDYYRSGTGSGGSVNVAYKTNLIEGLKAYPFITLNEQVITTYEAWIKCHPFDNGGGGWAAEPWHQREMLLTDQLVEEASRNSNKAIVVIGRTAGEDQDNKIAEGSYLLTKDEQDMLMKVTKYFTQVAVVLNVSNIIDMNWVNDVRHLHPIQSIIYVWQGGMEGGNAAADVLVGKVSPSGKLTDTIAQSIYDYPSTKNYGGRVENYYEEDIYVGYRYFETFDPASVLYEFGHGLSYTTFDMGVDHAKVIGQGKDATIEVMVRVRNTGDCYSGKEVVQLYYEAPQGKLGKPAKVLGAFKKTRQLLPKEEEVLRLELPIRQMASYDDAGATGAISSYVLEAGIYAIYIGSSVRKLSPIWINDVQGYNQNQLEVVEKLGEALAPRASFKRLKPGMKNEQGIYEKLYEVVPTAKTSIKSRRLASLPRTLEITGDKGYTLQDVYEKRIDMETFIAQLTKEELATLVRAEGMSSPLVTPGTASAFGGVSPSLAAYGLPVICTADGPSGIRMESGMKATQLPIGTLLAATWNVDLVEALYEREGEEMQLNEVDVLLGPGVNIRRSPLNGRNFEYFAEDPFITGAFAIAAAKGIAKSGGHATLKHFACNSQEQDRTMVDAIVSERAVREIYLKGFEMAVKEGHTQSIMTSYNPINGHWSASNYDLNTTILRNEWGYTGIVMTDWWAKMNHVDEGGTADYKHTSYMISAQNDLYMVVRNNGAKVNINKDDTLEAVEKGRLEIGELQRCAINICHFLIDTPAFNRRQSLGDNVRLFKAMEDLVRTDSVVEEPFKQVVLGMNQGMIIEIKEAGNYSIEAQLMSPDELVAQVSCNLYLNNDVVVTVQIQGSKGEWSIYPLGEVKLESGCYEVKFDPIKPHVEVQWVTFKKI